MAVTGDVATLDGGTPESLRGTDPYSVESHGIFNSLLRMQAAIDSNDQVAIQRVASELDNDLERTNFTRADLGAKNQSLALLGQRIDDENVELQSTLSKEIDVDLVSAISSLTARQASYQASLQLMAKTFQLSLMDYL